MRSYFVALLLEWVARSVMVVKGDSYCSRARRVNAADPVRPGDMQSFENPTNSSARHGAIRSEPRTWHLLQCIGIRRLVSMCRLASSLFFLGRFNIQRYRIPQSKTIFSSNIVHNFKMRHVVAGGGGAAAFMVQLPHRCPIEPLSTVCSSLANVWSTIFTMKARGCQRYGGSLPSHVSFEDFERLFTVCSIENSLRHIRRQVLHHYHHCSVGNWRLLNHVKHSSIGPPSVIAHMNAMHELGSGPARYEPDAKPFDVASRSRRTTNRPPSHPGDDFATPIYVHTCREKTLRVQPTPSPLHWKPRGSPFSTAVSKRSNKHCSTTLPAVDKNYPACPTLTIH